MTMNRYSKFLRSSELEPHHQMQFTVMPRFPLFELGGLTIRKECNQSILRSADQTVLKLKSSVNIKFAIKLALYNPLCYNAKCQKFCQSSETITFKSHLCNLMTKSICQLEISLPCHDTILTVTTTASVYR